MTEAETNNQKTERILRSLKNSYKKTFTSAHGKVVLDDLQKCIPEPMANEDPYRTYYELGRRNVMLMIEEKLKE